MKDKNSKVYKQISIRRSTAERFEKFKKGRGLSRTAYFSDVAEKDMDEKEKEGK